VPLPDSFREPDFEALRLNLARLRASRGWSYEELSERSGVSRASLISIETGRSRRRPGVPASKGTLDSWYRIARAFDVDLGEVLRPLYGELLAQDE
jgi:putative transcriptional regulator